jgi:CheY-like chemotaxis protein
VSALAGKTVLIAEDDPIQARLMGQAFQKAGATVETVKDGKLAHNLLLRGGFDAFVTDWMMPELDGIELARRLKGVQTRPFIVLVSALSMPEARAHAIHAGADEFFAKPMVQAKVVDAVARGIQNRASAVRLPATSEPARPKPAIDANHPVARTEAWKALPETLREVVGALLQVSPKLAPLDLLPGDATVQCVLPLMDAEHLMELHVRIACSRSNAVELARMMLGDPPPDDEATLTDLVSEVANVAAGAVKSAFVGEGYPFTLGLGARARQPLEDAFSVSELVALHAEKLTLFAAFGVKPRNAMTLAANRLREGMVLAESLLNDSGALILPLGTRLTASALNRLENTLRDRKIKVCVPDVAV